MTAARPMVAGLKSRLRCWRIHVLSGTAWLQYPLEAGRQAHQLVVLHRAGKHVVKGARFVEAGQAFSFVTL